jgi:tetratricopeptide (TPR) repeat protein
VSSFRGALQALLEKVERLGSQFADGDEAARLYSDLAVAYTRAAHHRRALGAARRAASLTSDAKFRADMNLQVVIALRRLKNYEDAVILAEQILPVWEELGEIDKLAETYIALGDVYRFAGNWPKARDGMCQPW